MNTSELYDAFRSEVADTARPYLWSDADVFRYMADAHRMYVRLIGGIADFDSVATSLDVVAGESLFTIHPSVLRVMRATRRSDGGQIEVINSTDLGKIRSIDYSQVKQLQLDSKAGTVRYMMIGANKKSGKWVQIPETNDTVDLMVYRLPLQIVSDADQEIYEVDEEHHIHLLDWMKHLAYKKQDADTFDKGRSDQFKADFETYCHQAKAEVERFKHKTRVVSYGGL